jgi:hypothetical protein
MKRLLGIVMALVIGTTGVAAGQEMGLFRSPVFVLQPGLIRSLSSGQKFNFNARFVTALPTSISKLTIVGIVQWTPFADKVGGGKANAPAFVYGPVVNLINERQFSFDIDGLFAYAPGCLNSASSYCHKFLVEGDFFLKLGSMMNTKGQWNSLALYAMLAYQLTQVPSGAQTKDHMALLLGLSLPLAPWKK